MRKANADTDLHALPAVVNEKYPSCTQPLAAAEFRPAGFEPVDHAILRDAKACGGMLVNN